MRNPYDTLDLLPEHRERYLELRAMKEREGVNYAAISPAHLFRFLPRFDDRHRKASTVGRQAGAWNGAPIGGSYD